MDDHLLWNEFKQQYSLTDRHLEMVKALNLDPHQFKDKEPIRLEFFLAKYIELCYEKEFGPLSNS